MEEQQSTALAGLVVGDPDFPVIGGEKNNLGEQNTVSLPTAFTKTRETFSLHNVNPFLSNPNPVGNDGNDVVADIPTGESNLVSEIMMEKSRLPKMIPLNPTFPENQDGNISSDPGFQRQGLENSSFSLMPSGDQGILDSIEQDFEADRVQAAQGNNLEDLKALEVNFEDMVSGKIVEPID